MQDWEQEARKLRKEWDSPALWPRIAAAIEAERRPRRPRWPLALAAALAVALGATLVWTFTRPAPPSVAIDAPRFLTEQALAEVQSSEQAYLESIDKLARLARPAIEMPSTPLLEAYSERLAVLDAAIAELRAEAERNPLYAHLQTQLSALYREKQTTLQEVLNAQN